MSNMLQPCQTDQERLALTRKLVELSSQEAVLKKTIEEKRKCLVDVQYQLKLTQSKLKSLKPSVLTKTKTLLANFLKWVRGDGENMDKQKDTEAQFSLSSFLEWIRYRGSRKSGTTSVQSSEIDDQVKYREVYSPSIPVPSFNEEVVSPLIPIPSLFTMKNIEPQWFISLDNDEEEESCSNLACVKPTPNFLKNIQSPTSTDTTLGSVNSYTVSGSKPSEQEKEDSISAKAEKIPLYPSVGFLREVAFSNDDQEQLHLLMMVM